MTREHVDLALDKGCEAADPDNVDGNANANGFTLTAANRLNDGNHRERGAEDAFVAAGKPDFQTKYGAARRAWIPGADQEPSPERSTDRVLAAASPECDRPAGFDDQSLCLSRRLLLAQSALSATERQGA